MNYSKCWLSYNPLTQFRDSELLKKIIVCRERSQAGAVLKNAVGELLTAISSILSIHPAVCYSADKTDNVKSGIVLGLTDEKIISEEGYRVKQDNGRMLLTGRTEKGLLYAVFDLIRRIAADSPLRGLDFVENPGNHLRMLNHWDNMDGSIERGYSGNSLFFKNEKILINERTKYYSRLAASVGINGTVINNVNVRGAAATGLVTDRYLDKLRKLADIFTGYGIKLFLSLNFAAPIEVGGLNTADPLDESVAAWWNRCVKHIYEKIPNFGGFLVKADSEGRPGPFTYQRTHADGSNMLARALKPYGGLVIWRCFVYNCRQDWRDYKTDRAKAAYDNFIGLDGEFDDNVILQIKNGPMDFQVREPVSPLFGGLRKTNMLLEVQAAQEYTGQQKHVCYLIPMWREVLDFNTYSRENASTVAEIISGKAYGQANCGMAAVSNTGNDSNWTGHDLAAANLYGFGRLSWNTGLSSEEIAEEWIRLTFPHDDKVLRTVSDILLSSWHTYEKYTAPLGIGWMVNPGNHYGPDVDGYEYDQWGTYHRADRNGMGIDRTKKGTGFAAQYNEPNSSMYENMETCPQELLLFFHHIPYDYELKSGVTLIQHIYDTHFEGVLEVENMLKSWNELKGLIPKDVYESVLGRFNIQLESSKEWRDRINTYFYRKSGIDDNKHRKIYY